MAGDKLIFSTHALHPEVTRELQALGEFRVASAPTPDAIDAESTGAEIIVVRAKISPEIIAREKQLLACVRHGAGLDMIPVELATQTGVIVANVPGANATTVAEHAIWSALSLLRQYPMVSRSWRQNGWEAARAHSNDGRELSGRTIGILGAGNIGRKVGSMARLGFGCKVIALTRTPENLPDGMEPVTLDGLLTRSDILVLSCPLTLETQGIISREAISKMRPGAILINVSRGHVTDEAALAEALASGHLAGAAIDVFSQQPLPSDHPYFDLTNVILTPHMAGITSESMLRMGQGVVTEVRAILVGEKPQNFCNPDVWERHRSRFGG